MKEYYLVVIALFTASAFVVFADGDIATPTQCPEKDPKSGMIRIKHENDCKKFYECVQGRKILRVCPYTSDYGYRLHFNPTRQLCDQPNPQVCKYDDWELARRCPPDLKHCHRIPHEKDCNKFYLCDGNREKVEQCADGLHFNPVTELCDYQKNAHCKDSCNWNCCPSKGSPVEVWLPHECSCSKYYECQNGDQILRRCPGEKHFDIRLRKCRDADVAGCVIKMTSPPTNAILRCPNILGGLVGFPHETECNLYYRCSGKELVQRKCRKGLSFNPRVGFCDFPENISCDNSSCCVSKQEVTSLPIPNYTKDDDVPPHDKEPKCPVESNIKLPHPSNCSLYYICENGKPILTACQWGLHFNALIEQCDWPSNAKCTSELEILEGAEIADYDSNETICHGKCPLSNLKDEVIHLPSNDCTKFCKCSAGVSYIIKCPKNLHYDRKEKVCNWPWLAKCIEDPAKDSTENLVAES